MSLRRATTAGLLALTACASAGTAARPEPARQLQPPPAATIRVGPMTPGDPGRVSAEDAAAILALGRSTAGPPANGHGHLHAGPPPVSVPLLTGDALTYAQQWMSAQQSVSRYDSIEKAAALGFVRTASPAAGVGTHWIKWSWVAEPFDPARPSMLLFDETRAPAVLVGYSYLLQSSSPPEGFAGPYDQWHQHTGLCVVNGWVDREEATGPAQCAGTYLAGGDVWMLHAWVVPAYPNRDGRFANANPMLCPRASSVPDFARCGAEEHPEG